MKLKYKDLEISTRGDIKLGETKMSSLETSNYSLQGFEICFNGEVIKVGVGLIIPNKDKNGNEYLVYSPKTITSDSVYSFRSFDTSNFTVMEKLDLGNQEKHIKLLYSCFAKLNFEFKEIKEDFNPNTIVFLNILNAYGESI